MKNTLLVLLSLIMVVFSTSAFAKKVEKLPVMRDGLYYEHLSLNLANGIYEKYYANGQLKWRYTYKDGKPNGLDEGYYENGQLSWRSTHKDGELEGIWEMYEEDGTLERKCIWMNDKIYECE
ncbi:hypothetical protein OAH55_02430 [Hellea sp.]|nr:hypothetical protein [Hellea sp.]MDB4844386.1 hypothetical protein [Hellea sp.]MDC0421872.1 hypothetical protein [Hellea sp.]